MSPPFPRFRLRTLLLAFLPIAGACFFIRDYVHNRPLHWDRYDLRALQSQLSQGHAVLVFVEGPACGRGRFVPTPCRDEQVMRYARNHNIAAMHAWYSEKLPGVRAESTGVLLVYSPSRPNEPYDIEWLGPDSSERLMVALRTAQGRGRIQK